MSKLVQVDTIYIDKPWNILPNIDGNIICNKQELIMSDFKIDINAYGLDWSKEGYLYCCDFMENKVHKLDNFIIVQSFDIGSPDDIIINNDEVIISECGKCNIYDSTFNIIDSLDIESCGQINIGKYDDILVCDYINNVINIYSYKYGYKYNIVFDGPWAVAMLNDTIFIIDSDGNLYCYDNELYYHSELVSAYYLKTSNNKLYVPGYHENKINIFEFIES